MDDIAINYEIDYLSRISGIFKIEKFRLEN